MTKAKELTCTIYHLENEQMFFGDHVAFEQHKNAAFFGSAGVFEQHEMQCH